VGDEAEDTEDEGEERDQEAAHVDQAGRRASKVLKPRVAGGHHAEVGHGECEAGEKHRERHDPAIAPVDEELVPGDDEDR